MSRNQKSFDRQHENLDPAVRTVDYSGADRRQRQPSVVPNLAKIYHLELGSLVTLLLRIEKIGPPFSHDQSYTWEGSIKWAIGDLRVNLLYRNVPVRID